ncbi:hypothetical protein TL16_g10299 [Triparma laevis f. inornata]|uniref:Uncharacterized protein n=2 Tax=Triparma laevis TaxID=1534972 RepID=A0A9W7FU80_9STRA|nr:hypothetical protein TL16_g10299 [Triparma laevis f. inornata]GMI18225.1 hypothetical protein TrLO_g15065 [Triparma laevis f. longispina]
MSAPSLAAFIANSVSTSTPTVLITSGGTSVPLESNTVRTLENFSTGTRGSTSAELFLSSGYRVIFMHRIGSKLPFLRQIPSPTNVTPELANLIKDCPNPSVSTPIATFNSNLPNLYLLPFTTVTTYLSLLESTLKSLSPLDSLSIYYGAAAVSDFYLKKPPKHKIQSTSEGRSIANDNNIGEGFELKLDSVPKLLGDVKVWCPGIFVCGFKLETDPKILTSKVEKSIEKYGLDCVVGNVLGTRYEVCYLYDKGGAEEVRGRVEEGIVEGVVGRHMEYVCREGGSLNVCLEGNLIGGGKKERDERIWREMDGWKKGIFWGWERLGPVIGVALVYYIRRRKW